jgi:hypothetical protein
MPRPKPHTLARTAPETRPAVSAGAIVALIVLGFVIRLALAAISWGSNDSIYFYAFGNEINAGGLLHTYVENPDYNHPPIPGLWAAGTRLATQWLGNGTLAISAFCILFKLPVILADGATASLLYKRWRPEAGPRSALGVAAAFACALAPILVSGYHGNTDPIYAMFCLLSAYLLERDGGDERRAFAGLNPLLAGLALAGAINIKLLPVLLIPPLLLSLRRPRDMFWFLLGLSVGVLPFLPLLWKMGPAFYRNALAYNPSPNRWGVLLIPLWHEEYTSIPPPGFIRFYHSNGRYLIFALVLAWSVAARVLRRWNRYDVAAVTFAIFLVFAPGYGVQYSIILAPLLFATRPRFALLYCTAAGLFLLTTYFLYLADDFPLQSMFVGYLPREAAVVGVPVWGLLIYYVVSTILRPARVTDPPASSVQSASDDTASAPARDRHKARADRR